MLTEATIAAYLDRISAPRPAKPDLASLRAIQAGHLYSVPFENLGYHLAEEIHMDERVVDKIVNERRGGGCYEVNPALSFLLEGLGYDVSLLPGRVWIKGELTAPLHHLALKVRIDGHSWLVDVGFGRNSRYPLSLGTEEAQDDPNGRFQVTAADDGGIDVRANDALQYRVYDVPCRLSDFGPTLWWYRTAPDSPFLQNLFCSLPTADGRVTLKGDRLTVFTGDGKESRRLADEQEVREAYEKWFGIKLDRLPAKASDGPAVPMSFE
ncbi:arylamine N-acetyltransferase family protein [Streptomyces sp. NRRL B-1347]|uniref:arylamine N-acetyltransferase family protein n=1 Tax=Streptomyces sp. NRRL B-1347 TaxID=1476877 RepID=UPI000566CDD5|nr:arylamine N-acetyltransferase [Streptomyces sp. NRRL B-1347]